MALIPGNKRKALDFETILGDDGTSNDHDVGASETESEQSAPYRRPTPGSSATRSTSEGHGHGQNRYGSEDRGRGWNQGDQGRSSSVSRNSGGWNNRADGWNSRSSWESSSGGQGKGKGKDTRDNTFKQDPRSVRHAPEDDKILEWYQLTPMMREILGGMFPYNSRVKTQDNPSEEVMAKDKIRFEKCVERFGPPQSTGLALHLKEYLTFCNGGDAPIEKQSQWEEALIWRAWCEGVNCVYEQSKVGPLPAFPAFTLQMRKLLKQDKYFNSYVTERSGTEGDQVKRTEITSVSPCWGLHTAAPVDLEMIRKRFPDEVRVDPLVRCDLCDGLHALSILEIRVFGTSQCGFCMMQQGSVDKPGQHAALQCPLMLESRNPAGMGSNPFFFGYFQACYMENVIARRPGLTKIGRNRLKRRLTYVFDLQYDTVSKPTLWSFHDNVKEYTSALCIRYGKPVVFKRIKNDCWNDVDIDQYEEMTLNTRSFYHWGEYLECIVEKDVRFNVVMSAWDIFLVQQPEQSVGGRKWVKRSGYEYGDQNAEEVVEPMEIDPQVKPPEPVEHLVNVCCGGWVGTTVLTGEGYEEETVPWKTAFPNFKPMVSAFGEKLANRIVEMRDSMARPNHCIDCEKACDMRRKPMIWHERWGVGDKKHYDMVMESNELVCQMLDPKTHTEFPAKLASLCLACFAARIQGRGMDVEERDDDDYEPLETHGSVYRHHGERVVQNIVCDVCATDYYLKNGTKWTRVVDYAYNISDQHEHMAKDLGTTVDGGFTLDYGCVYCLEHIWSSSNYGGHRGVTEREVRKFRCRRCHDDGVHYAMWIMSLAYGPICVQCALNSMADGDCPHCGQMVVDVRDWVPVQGVLETREMAPLYVCIGCATLRKAEEKTKEFLKELMFTKTVELPEGLKFPDPTFTKPDTRMFAELEMPTVVKQHGVQLTPSEGWVNYNKSGASSSDGKASGEKPFSSLRQAVLTEVRATMDSAGESSKILQLLQNPQLLDADVVTLTSMFSVMGLTADVKLLDLWKQKQKTSMEAAVLRGATDDDQSALIYRSKVSGAIPFKQRDLVRMSEEDIAAMVDERVKADIEDLKQTKVGLVKLMVMIKHGEDISKMGRISFESVDRGFQYLSDTAAEPIKDEAVAKEIQAGLVRTQEVRIEALQEQAQAKKEVVQAEAKQAEQKAAGDPNDADEDDEAYGGTTGPSEKVRRYCFDHALLNTSRIAKCAKTITDKKGEVRPMVRLIEGIEVYHLDYKSIEAGGYTGERAWNNFTEELLPKCGSAPAVPSLGCHGIRGSSGDGYDIPGTKNFGEVLLCGAGDGMDEQAKRFGEKLISLGRRAHSKMKAGYARGDAKCSVAKCDSKQHGWSHGLVITAGAWRDGLKELNFYSPDGNTRGTDPRVTDVMMMKSMFEEFFVPMVICDGYKGGKLTGECDVTGYCALCGTSISISVPTDFLEKELPAYGEFVTDYPEQIAGMPFEELKGIGIFGLMAKMLDVTKGDVTWFGGGHLQSKGHLAAVQFIEDLNGMVGRPKRGCGPRHCRKSTAVGNNCIVYGNQKFYFDNVSTFIPYPCYEAVCDFVGADAGGLAAQVMHWVSAGQLTVNVAGNYYQAVIGDIASASVVVIRWNPVRDGFHEATGRYGCDETLIHDVVTIPRTYKEYFEMIGVKTPLKDVSDDAEPRNVGDALDQGFRGHPAVPLSKKCLKLMAESAAAGTTIVMSEDDVALKPQQLWAREIFPPTDNERTWWLGVALRWSDNPRWKSHDNLAKYMEGKLVIVCIDQAARPIYVAKEYLDSKKSAEKFGVLAPTPGSSYVVGWMATGGNWSLGNGITTRVDALRQELEFRSDKDPASLSTEERAVLAMSETERVERCVKLLNMTLESGNLLSLQTQHFSAALAKTDQDKRHGVGGVGELSRNNKVNLQPRQVGSSSRESSASESVVEGYTASEASDNWQNVRPTGRSDKGRGQ